jgi:hypothetical protein
MRSQDKPGLAIRCGAGVMTRPRYSAGSSSQVAVQNSRQVPRSATRAGGSADVSLTCVEMTGIELATP